MASNQAVGSTDSMLFSWGSSVNVCEDSRRNIRQELDRMENDIVNLIGKAKSEDRVSAQVNKDFSHARTEMSNYRRGAADVLDSARMNDQVRARLMESLKADLLNPLRKHSTNSPTHDSYAKEDGVENAANQLPSSVMAFVEQRDSDLMELVQSGMNRKREVHEIMTKKNALLEAMAVIRNAIEQDDLVDGIAISVKTLSDRAIELENEQRRMRTTKMAVHEARTKCGSYAQDIADRTKILTASKAQNAMEELALAEELARAESELITRDELVALKSKCDIVTQQVDTLKTAIAEVESLGKARSERQQHLKILLLELTKATSKSEIQLVNVGKATDFAMYVARELDGAKKAKMEVEALSNENDIIEKWHADNGLPEQAELAKEKERLAAAMTSLAQTKSQAPYLELQTKLQEQEELLDALVETAKKDDATLEEKRTLVEDLRKVIKESGETFAKSLPELVQVGDSLNEAKAAEKQMFSALKNELKKMRTAALNDKQIEGERFRAQILQKRDILGCGSEMLESFCANQQKIKEAFEALDTIDDIPLGEAH